MHRVFRSAPAACSASDAPFEAIRSALRAGGCSEHELAGALLYSVMLAGEQRHVATLSHGRRTATLYLYPDALGGPRGLAVRFYRLLDEADLNLGSKAGPSIGIDLDDDAQVRLVCDCLRDLLADRRELDRRVR
ncbi:MAG TPA: hypothetical protein VH916_07885 [Dehalococcoidia bacterium]